MLQIQITQIDNGFLMASPPEQNPITGNKEGPKMLFASNLDEVKTILEDMWPQEEEEEEEKNQTQLFK